MFEGNLPIGAPESGGEGAEKRAFDWHELVIRLAAARDARAALSPFTDYTAASFGNGAADFLAHSGVRHDDEIRPVNLDGLEHGKSHKGNRVAAAHIAAEADRETV